MRLPLRHTPIFLGTALVQKTGFEPVTLNLLGLRSTAEPFSLLAKFAVCAYLIISLSYEFLCVTSLLRQGI